MINHTNIPAEAINAAKKVAFERYGSQPDAAYIRTILAAAAAHFLAQGWDEGAAAYDVEGCETAVPCGDCDGCNAPMPPNPYRAATV